MLPSVYVPAVDGKRLKIRQALTGAYQGCGLCSRPPAVMRKIRRMGSVRASDMYTANGAKFLESIKHRSHARSKGARRDATGIMG